MRNTVRLKHGWKEGGRVKEMRMTKEIVKILTNYRRKTGLVGSHRQCGDGALRQESETFTFI